MAGNLNWNQIRADFHDANQSMATSGNALSQAGTVFGQLRKSILDEEQRAVDNAFREQKFNEDVRQFGLKHALENDRLREMITHNRNSEDLTWRGQDIQMRGQDIQAKANSLARERFNWEKQQVQQANEARQKYYNWLDETDKQYKQATTQYKQDRDAYFKENFITDTNQQELDKNIQDTDAALAANDAAIRDATLGHGVDREKFDISNVDFWGNPTPDSQLQIQGPVSSPEVRKLLEDRRALEGQQQLNTLEKERMDKLRAAYDAEHPVPVNGLPQDPLTRAMMFERMTGLPVSKEFLGAIAVQAMENAQKQVQAEAQYKTATDAAAIRAGGSHKGDKDSSIKWWTSRGVKDSVNAGNADMITNAISQIAKSKGKDISKDTIRNEILSSLFSRSALSRVTWKDNELTPEGWTGSTSDLENVLNYILGNDKNPSSSTKATVARLLSKLGLN